MPDDQQLEAPPAVEGEYEPPAVTSLGSVAELTGGDPVPISSVRD